MDEAKRARDHAHAYKSNDNVFKTEKRWKNPIILSETQVCNKLRIVITQ